MLKIKKLCVLKMCKINLQFLFKKKFNSLSKSEKTFTKKTKSNSIILRSPKHFNISKHKIVSLNYRTPCMYVFINKIIFLPSLNKLQVYNILKQIVKISSTTTIKSCKLFIKTKFKIINWQVGLL